MFLSAGGFLLYILQLLLYGLQHIVRKVPRDIGVPQALSVIFICIYLTFCKKLHIITDFFSGQEEEVSETFRWTEPRNGLL